MSKNLFLLTRRTYIYITGHPSDSRNEKFGSSKGSFRKQLLLSAFKRFRKFLRHNPNKLYE